MDCKLRTGTCLQDGWSSVLLTEWYVIIGHPCQVKFNDVAFVGDWVITASVSIA